MNSIPSGLNYVLQNSPPELGIYLVIDRTAGYTYDLTQVTSVSAAVTLPGGTKATWTFSPVPSMTTSARLVASRSFGAGDTAVLGTMVIVATPFIGAQKLPPAGPFRVTIRGPSLT